MRVQVLQHMPIEGIGQIAAWFAQRGIELTYSRFWLADAALPDPRDLDLVVVMGGPMSVNDEAELPWLVAEKAFLREAITAGVAVLGICLGAQLIASALGARVKANAVTEIGWFEVLAVATEALPVFDFPERITLLHWHGETFELPAGATLLASSAACAHQAFQLGDRVIGLQCHPEMTQELVAGLLHECAAELQPGPWVRTAAELAAVPVTQYAAGHGLLDRVLDYLSAAHHA